MSKFKPTLSWAMPLIFTFLTSLSITGMVLDHKNAPPPMPDQYGYDYTLKYDDSFGIHLALVIVGYTIYFVLLLLKNIQKKHYLYSIFMLVFLGNTIWAWLSVIHMNGITIIFGFWSVFLLVSTGLEWGVILYEKRKGIKVL